jgi:hypothetical protein
MPTPSLLAADGSRVHVPADVALLEIILTGAIPSAEKSRGAALQMEGSQQLLSSG